VPRVPPGRGGDTRSGPDNLLRPGSLIANMGDRWRS
jgi:hypothetical protein